MNGTIPRKELWGRLHLKIGREFMTKMEWEPPGRDTRKPGKCGDSDYGRFKTGNRKEKKNVSYHYGSVSLVFTNKAPVTNGREMLLC